MVCVTNGTNVAPGKLVTLWHVQGQREPTNPASLNVWLQRCLLANCHRTSSSWLFLALPGLQLMPPGVWCRVANRDRQFVAFTIDIDKRALWV